MQITCTFNPTDAEHWLNTDFWIHGDTETVTCLHSTYTDNRFVGEEYKKVMDRLVETNRNYYNIYALGQR
jgi:phage terminase large subunit